MNQENWNYSIFVQRSKGAEPEPPVKIEYYNGCIVISQGTEERFISISPESIEDFFNEIRKQLK